MKRSTTWEQRIRAGALAACVTVALGAGSTHVLGGTNLVYVESNTGCSASNSNSVYAYVNDGAGNLTPVSGSPFLTGGTGVCDPGGASTSFDADQQVIVNPAGTQLFAVNGHTNTVAVFDINSDGSLTPIAGSPFASGGQEPMSLGLANNILTGNVSVLTVANKNADPNQSGGTPNFTTFNVNSAGTMTANSGSTVNLASGASPSQALTNASAKLMFGMQFGGKLLNSYRIKANGQLGLVNSVGPPAGGVLLGEAMHPTLKDIYAGVPNLSQIAVYSYDSTGTLSFVRTVADTGSLICWLIVNPAGTRLYTAETGSGTVSVYGLAHDKFPTFLQKFRLSGSTPHPSNIALDPTGKFLYALDQTASKGPVVLHVLNVLTNGTLSETAAAVTLPVASSETPIGVATVMK